MVTRNIIQVFEHQKLYYSDDGPFKELHWKALSDYAEIEKKDYFTVLRKGIKFSNYVGVIQAINLTIEILPKTDIPELTAANEVISDNNEKALWHKVLLEMLEECKLLKVDSSNKALLKLRNYNLLEIYILLFLEETEKLLHGGLIRKYRKKESNVLALKGQLLFAKNLTNNLIHKERFYVRHSTYDTNNTFNQLIYKTLKIIPKLSNSVFLKDKVNRLLFSFPELDDFKVNMDTFNRLTYDRKTERYKDPLLISKMILLHYHPDISGGQENVVAILFDMNKLWEEFVYRRLKKEEANYKIKANAQQSADFWKPSHVNYSKTIRPDIVITFDVIEKKGNLTIKTEKTLVVDTKWKLVQNLTPSDEDLKQMFAYNLFWKCDKSILLYPSTSKGSGFGDYHSFEKADEFINRCCIEKVSVLDAENKGIDSQFGNNTLNILLGNYIKDLKR